MRGALTFAAGSLVAIAGAAFAQVMTAPRPSVPIILKPPIAVKPMPMPLPMAPLALNYSYTAVPQSGAPRQQGSINAGSIWTCDQTSCKMTSPADQPAIGGCNALAQHIGPIGSYGRNGAMLSPEQLDQCNRAIPGAIRMAADAPAPEPVPSEPAPAAEAPAPAPATSTGGAAARFSIVSSEVSVTGGAQGTVDPLPGRLAVASGELSLTGGAQGVRPTASPPMTITVPELSVSGR
jgi:hypothetical protein